MASRPALRASKSGPGMPPIPNVSEGNAGFQSTKYSYVRYPAGNSPAPVASTSCTVAARPATTVSDDETTVSDGDAPGAADVGVMTPHSNGPSHASHVTNGCGAKSAHALPPSVTSTNHP